MDEAGQDEICRVCRCEAQTDRPLFYPCVCTGSIKYIHQDCLMQWMRYSHKEYCELCGHRFSFQPIYSPDMPRVLPVRDLMSGLMSAVFKAIKSWAHYSLVGLAWFIIVPITAYRTYRYLFRASSFDMILSLPFDVFSMENIASDVFRGCFVVTCTLLSFIGLVWLREQILLGGGPDWLDRDDVAGLAEVAGGAVNRRPVLGANIRGNNVRENVAAEPLAEDQPIARDMGAEDNANRIDEQPVQEGRHDDGNLERDNTDGALPASQVRVGAADLPAEPSPRPNNEEAHENDAEHRVQPANNVVPAVVPDPNNVPNVNEVVVNRRRRMPFDILNNDNNNNGGGGAQPPAAIDNDNDEPNWNPMEWDRAAEDLTWERLLGLDGSLVFLEHVFWIISLNIMLIFAFAFCPYCIGQFVLRSLNLLKINQPLLHFHGLVITLFGYCFIGQILVLLHYLAKVFHMRRVRNLIGLCYIVVKVSLLSVVEIGVLPLICGWWLDICSLPLFDASLKDRKSSFVAAPGTSLFVHWMFGMVYVYYFAAFVSLLREVLRPGVLWFLRNLNDPDFSPIQEMIHLPILKHIRRLISSAMIFGTVVLLIFWVPTRILKVTCSTFLPYTLSGDSEVNELSLQLLLLQVIVPGVLEQSHTRIWLKKILRTWCLCVSYILGLRSYLLGNDRSTTVPRRPKVPNANGNDENEESDNDRGELGSDDDLSSDESTDLNDIAAENQDEDSNEDNDEDEDDEDDEEGDENEDGHEDEDHDGNDNDELNELERRVNNILDGFDDHDPLIPPGRIAVPPRRQPQGVPHMNADRNLAAAHHAIIQRDVPLAFKPYKRPTFFALRLCGLMIFVCISLVIASLIVLTVPIWVGRRFMAMWYVSGGSISNQVILPTGMEVTNSRPHELYTSTLGTYICWLITRIITIAATLLPQGRAAVIAKLKHWFNVGISYALPILVIVLLLGVIPLLFGLLLELVVIIPLRVTTHQTPVYFLSQDWALGVLYTKIAIALTFMGPDWSLKRILERAYRDGLRDIDLKFIIYRLGFPVIAFFGLALAIPYVFAYSVLPLLCHNPSKYLLVQHFVYPGFYSFIGIVAFINFEINQFRKLYVAIKVDKYLVGQRLVNYENRKKQQQQQQQEQEQQQNLLAAAMNQEGAHNRDNILNNNNNNGELAVNNGPNIVDVLGYGDAGLNRRQRQRDDQGNGEGQGRQFLVDDML